MTLTTDKLTTKDVTNSLTDWNEFWYNSKEDYKGKNDSEEEVNCMEEFIPGFHD